MFACSVIPEKDVCIVCSVLRLPQNATSVKHGFMSGGQESNTLKELSAVAKKPVHRETDAYSKNFFTKGNVEKCKIETNVIF